MLNAEFVREIGSQAVNASGLQVIAGPQSDGGRFIRVYDRTSRELKLVRGEPGVRRDVVQRPEDVVAVVNRRLAEPGVNGRTCEVFVGDASIVGVFTEGSGHRDHTVTMPLHVNPAFEAIEKLADADDPKWMSHGAFVEFLRVELAGCMNLADFELWRRLKFSSQTGGTSNIKAGNESMDRSVQLGTFTEGGVEIPEYIEFNLPVYDECATVEQVTNGETIEQRRWRVRCAVVVSTVKQEFALRPMTDELEQARRDAKQWLIGKLKGVAEGVLVVTGSPG